MNRKTRTGKQQRNLWKGMKPLRTWMSAVALLTVFMLAGCSDERFVVLNPAGPVGRTEYHLIVLSVILLAIVVIPVLALLVFIVIRYRDKPGNTAPYKPDWADSKALELIWWGIPIVIIAVLGSITAKETFALAKTPVSDSTPITIQVTSLDWKWVFEYPEQNIATVNYCEIPVGVPVQFVLTSDAPMNSFWVPQLGGQEYTMPGMSLGLWLQADKAGEYYGTGANFSGEGFAHMQFRVAAHTQSDFNNWVQQVKRTEPALTKDGYDQLVKPSNVGELTYSSFPAGLYEEVVNKNGGIYMQHQMPGMYMNGTNGTPQTMDPSMSMKH